MQSSAVHVQLLHHSFPLCHYFASQCEISFNEKMAKYKNTKDASNPQYATGKPYSAFLPLIS